MTTVDLIAGVIRGEVTEWPDGASPFAADLLQRIDDDRVGPLVAWRLRRAGTLEGWPEPVRQALTEQARRGALSEAAREDELRRVLTALDREGVSCLLMKGAALAYTCYAQPWLRPRVDSDLLIGEDDVSRTSRVLTGLGYEQANDLEGESVTHQHAWVLLDRHGLQHVLDVHWKISNRPKLAGILSFEELWEQARRVDTLGGRVPDDVNAMLLACLHRLGHHRNTDDLLWAYDVHLLADRFDEAAWDRFVAVAREKQIAAICWAGLSHARLHFHTAVPSQVMEQLAVAREPSAEYFHESTWRGDVRLSDLRALSGWRAKLQYVRDVAVPRSDYLLREYRCTNRALVPALHAHRLARGTWRLLRRFAG